MLLRQYEIVFVFSLATEIPAGAAMSGKSTDEIPTLFKLGLSGGAIVLGEFLVWISSTASCCASFLGGSAVPKQSKSS